MRYAITPRGAGKLVSARAIEDDWELTEGETFSVGHDEYAPGMVLGEDGVSLAPAPAPQPRYFTFDQFIDLLTPQENAAIRSARAASAAIDKEWERLSSRTVKPVDMLGNSYQAGRAMLAGVLGAPREAEIHAALLALARE